MEYKTLGKGMAGKTDREVLTFICDSGETGAKTWEIGMRLWAVMIWGIFAGAVGAETLNPTPVAWFTDNGDRQALQELRDRPAADLTAMDRAILTAGNRIGWITLPGCRRASNAILIRVGARDAVVTSRHLVAGMWRDDLACAADEPAFYQMNASYREPGYSGLLSADDLTATVALEPGPLNYAAQGLMMQPSEDWLVYFLTETISDKPMPEGAFGAGELRGAMPFSTRHPPQGKVYVIGYDGRFGAENGWQMSWQACEFFQNNGNPGTLLRSNPIEPGVIYLGCDAAPGASSSLLATVEDGELTLQGLVTAVMDRLTGTDLPLPKSAILWNLGTSAKEVEAATRAAP